MQRVISGVVLGAVALALIWFLTSIALLGVALAVAAMAFHEYDRIVQKIGAKSRIDDPAGDAARLFDGAVPVGRSNRCLPRRCCCRATCLHRLGSRTAAGTRLRCLRRLTSASLCSLVGVHAIVGRKACYCRSTVAVSDTAHAPGARWADAAGAVSQSEEDARARWRVRDRRSSSPSPVGCPISRARHASPARIVVAGIIGDLFESMLKRAADMKDSGDHTWPWRFSTGSTRSSLRRSFFFSETLNAMFQGFHGFRQTFQRHRSVRRLFWNCLEHR
jgi:hypothetical protein